MATVENGESLVQPMHRMWDVSDVVCLILDYLPDRDPAMKSMMRMRHTFWEIAVKRLWKKVDFHDLCLIFRNVGRNKYTQCNVCSPASHPHIVVSNGFTEEDWKRLSLYVPYICRLSIRITSCIEFQELMHRFCEAKRPILPWNSLHSLVVTMGRDSVSYGTFPLAAFVTPGLQQVAFTMNGRANMADRFRGGDLLASFFKCLKLHATALQDLRLRCDGEDLLENTPGASAALLELLTTSATSLRHFKIHTKLRDPSFGPILAALSLLSDLKTAYVSVMRMESLQLPFNAFPSTSALRMEGNTGALLKMLENVTSGPLQALQLSIAQLPRAAIMPFHHAFDENGQLVPGIIPVDPPISTLLTCVGRFTTVKRLRMDLEGIFGWGEVAIALRNLQQLERLWVSCTEGGRAQPINPTEFRRIISNFPALTELVLLGPRTTYPQRPPQAHTTLADLCFLGSRCPNMETLIVDVDVNQDIPLDEAITPFPRLTRAILPAPEHAFGSEQVRNLGRFLKKLMPNLKFLGGLASSQQCTRVAFQLGVSTDEMYLDNLQNAAEFHVLS